MKRPYTRKSILERIEKAIAASRTALNRSRRDVNPWSQSDYLHEIIGLLADAIHLATEKIKENELNKLRIQNGWELADALNYSELLLLKQLKTSPGTACFFADKSINERLTAIWQREPKRLIRLDRDGIISWMLSGPTWAAIDDAVRFREKEELPTVDKPIGGAS